MRSLLKNSSFTRFIFDLHKISGVYELLLMLILVLTGVLLELPDTFNPLIHRVSPLYEMPVLTSQKQNQPRISVLIKLSK